MIQVQECAKSIFECVFAIVFPKGELYVRNSMIFISAIENMHENCQFSQNLSSNVPKFNLR